MNGTVTAPAGIPSALMHPWDRLQLQFLILAKFINNCSTELGPF